MTRPVPMEVLVRPFQSPRITPLHVNFVAPLPPGIAEAKLGGSGSRTTSFTLDGVGFIVKGNNEQYGEVDRKSKLVRVENEDDPEQFVEICRADSIKFKEKKKSKSEEDEDNFRQSGYTTRKEGFSTTIFDSSQQGRAKLREWDMQHPDEKTCKPKTKPKRGGNC